MENEMNDNKINGFVFQCNAYSLCHFSGGMPGPFLKLTHEE